MKYRDAFYCIGSALWAASQTTTGVGKNYHLRAVSGLRQYGPTPAEIWTGKISTF